MKELRYNVIGFAGDTETTIACYCPEWGDDWGAFLAAIDGWNLIEQLDKAGRLEVQP